MPIADELSGFVKDALVRGLSRRQIEDVLLQAGWTVSQVRAALAGFAPLDFPIPVPAPRPSLSARDAFMHLLLFSTLYLSAYNLGSLLFQIIDWAFPDPAAEAFAAGVEYSRQAMRWSVSSLVVAFPVFLRVSWSIGRAIRQDPNKGTSKVRRWLTYLTLFAAASLLIGDVIGLVYSFLGGELTARFLLKVATVGVIAATIFWYYLSELRSEDREP